MAGQIMTKSMSIPDEVSERSGFLFKVATLRCSEWLCISRTAPTPRSRFGIDFEAGVQQGRLICRETSAEFGAWISGMAGEIGAEAGRNWYSTGGAETRLKEGDGREQMQ